MDDATICFIIAVLMVVMFMIGVPIALLYHFGYIESKADRMHRAGDLQEKS